MKRDLDLVKAILLHFEDKEDWAHEKQIDVEGYDKKLVSYHLSIMYEAGLINCEPMTSNTGRIYDVVPFRLTWDGHEFLDNIKDQGRWQKIKETLKKKGGDFSMGLVKALAFKLAEQELLG